MEEELEDQRAIAGEMFLEIVDVLIALFPEAFVGLLGRAGAQPLGVHFHHQHVLVIRSVEDADAAALGQRLHVSPQEIVIQFLGGRFLETEHLAALRIHAGHDVADGAILASGIHRLENDEHRVGIRRVEQFL